MFDGGKSNILEMNGNIEISGHLHDIIGGSGNEVIINDGVFTSSGSIDLRKSVNAFQNKPGAVFNSGRQVALGKKSLFFNEGELSPGGADRIKQTMFGSNFKQSDKGIFTTTVDTAGGLSDLLYVTEKADLQGGTVKVREINLGKEKEAVQKKGMNSPRKYQILIAKAGVSGRFGNVISSSLTEGKLDYGPNEVYLSLKKPYFCDLTQTDNERGCSR